MSIFDLFSDAKDLASEYIEDPDLRNKLLAKLDAGELEVYKIALQTKTVPWVDSVHKMSRPFISVVTVVAPMVILAIHPDIDIQKLLIVTGVGAVPGAIYTKLKGKGN